MSAAGGPWAVRLPVGSPLAAAALRLRPGVLVRAADGELWLRGDRLTDDLDLELRKLPGAQRFAVDANGTLIPHGSRIPRGSLPDAGWQPLSDYLTPAPQPAALGGELTQRATLRLTRTTREEPATVLLTTLDHWTAYATAAPQVRLESLQFATTDDGRAAIRGSPLPPLPGQRYTEREGIAVPTGFALTPALDSATLRAVLGTTAADLAVFADDSSWELIRDTDFTPATRPSARATAAAHSPLARIPGRGPGGGAGVEPPHEPHQLD